MDSGRQEDEEPGESGRRSSQQKK